MKVTLSKAISAHGEDMTELDMREPTAEDVMELGFPYLVVQSDDGQGVELRPKVAGRYISRLAKIPMSSVKQMAVGDLSKLQGLIMGFFGQGEEDDNGEEAAQSE
ncbi:phage tail assembly protein [Paraburkholderia terrae]|uniref:phage tail assembly protein n=1 Tax=Paraburkholderia terrae TaxID=311230 RepID=UPI001EE30550|nr:phage tail assembly protein [Paraburkholderia terrae]GJH05036.1 phage tail assembly protein [Paraburkholderia terrae]